ncbi:MAG: alkaline phosphatase D family protein, partial [Woeseiaceae bacterium]
IASPGPFLPFSYQEKGQDLRYVGAWDAYPANRRRVADHLAAAGNGHPLILSGDIHSFWAMDGRQFADPAEQFDVSEFVTSSISANWPAPLAEPVSDNLGNNPQVEYYEPAYRGYLLHDINARNWTVTARGVIDAKIPSSGVKTLATFDVAHGQPGFQQR